MAGSFSKMKRQDVKFSSSKVSLDNENDDDVIAIRKFATAKDIVNLTK